MASRFSDLSRANEPSKTSTLLSPLPRGPRSKKEEEKKHLTFSIPPTDAETPLSRIVGTTGKPLTVTISPTNKYLLGDLSWDRRTVLPVLFTLLHTYVELPNIPHEFQLQRGGGLSVRFTRELDVRDTYTKQNPENGLITGVLNATSYIVFHATRYIV